MTYPVGYQAGPAWYPEQYQAQQWQGILAVVTGALMAIGMAAWALSSVRKAWKGEDVRLPG